MTLRFWLNHFGQTIYCDEKRNEKSSFKRKIKCIVLNDVKFEMPFSLNSWMY